MEKERDSYHQRATSFVANATISETARRCGEAMERTEAERIVLKAGWLSRQPGPFQIALLRRARLVTFAKGEHAYAAGDTTGSIYGVAQGGFGCEVVTRYSDSRLAHIMRDGTWFGTGPVHTDTPRLFTFRAVERSIAFSVPMAALHEIAAVDTSAFRRLAALSEENMRLSGQVVSDLLLPSSEQRIVAVLLRAAGVTVGDPLPPPHSILVTQSELGEMANASRDVVNRVLGRLESKGLIGVGHGRIEIADAGALLALMRTG
jgi:CRP-like cAMP-binding protein